MMRFLRNKKSNNTITASNNTDTSTPENRCSPSKLRSRCWNDKDSCCRTCTNTRSLQDNVAPVRVVVQHQKLRVTCSASSITLSQRSTSLQSASSKSLGSSAVTPPPDMVFFCNFLDQLDVGCWSKQHVGVCFSAEINLPDLALSHRPLHCETDV